MGTQEIATFHGGDDSASPAMVSSYQAKAVLPLVSVILKDT